MTSTTVPSSSALSFSSSSSSNSAAHSHNSEDDSSSAPAQQQQQQPSNTKPYFTYRLGSSLYVPLTSRSNTVTLPASRGPRFVLPAHAVAALCRVRDAEADVAQFEHWCRWLETQDGSLALPEDKRERSLSLDRPTVAELLHEIQQQVQQNAQCPLFHSIVIAGEGEPLVRMSDLRDLIQQIRALETGMALRLTTNGLVPTISSSTVSTQDDDENVPLLLQQAGLDAVSVALQTDNAVQYDAWMEPEEDDNDDSSSSENSSSAHARVCRFIHQAVQAGLTVEATAVERPEVSPDSVQALSKSLGVSGAVRWRPYFGAAPEAGSRGGLWQQWFG